uniref:Uncharacterized protein TCIL3000_10_13960 n=1 Tax=Trypanosoma congolense (strain IL3000) TaxID=1068625 RepID=G0UYZ3_TRYCI|nr:unnamed protein product [Trypanosoma congolense IL3000]
MSGGDGHSKSDESAPPVDSMAVEMTVEEPQLDGETIKNLSTEGREQSSSGIFGKLSLCLATLLPSGGIAASAFNIAATTVGAGIFGTPAAAKSSGLVMGMVYLIVICFLTILSMHALAVAADRSKARTYEEVTRVLLGKWAAYILAGIRAFLGFSGCVAFIISVGDIFSSILNDTNAPDFWKSNAGNRLLTSLLWLCFMLPLVVLRKADSLRHVSTFAVSFMVYFVIVIVIHSCMNGLPENIKSVSVGKSDDAEIILFNSGNVAIEGLGVFMFAMICQITAYEVYVDMKDRSIKKFVIASTISTLLSCALYAMTAFFGYMDFGKLATGSILLMYDPVKEPAIMVGMVGVIIKLCASYSLLAMACRNALYDVVGIRTESLAFWKHCVSVVLLSVVMLLFGLFIPKVNTVFGLAGSIAGGSLGFIYPALLVMYSGGFTIQKVGLIYYLGTYALLFCGVMVMVFGTGATILATFS